MITGGVLGKNMIGAVTSQFVPKGVYFDGTNDYLIRASDLTDNADSGIFTFCLRFKLGVTGVFQQMLHSNSTKINFIFFNDERILIQAFSTSTEILQWSTSLTGSASAWKQLLVSIDLSDTNKRHIYINDTAEPSTTPSIYTNANIDFTQTSWAVARRTFASSIYTGDMAELFFAPGVYIDFSVEANRRKFNNADGTAVDLGEDGSIPLGVQPAIYLSVREGDDPSAFATNRGYGGNFTVVGALEASSTDPVVS